MPLLIKPTLTCNSHCAYCYEGSLRKSRNFKPNYNLPVILEQMEKHKDCGLTLHGGEPLCIGKEDVETILAKSFLLSCSPDEKAGQRGRHSGLQTNGKLIDNDYMEMFSKYNTCVGISMDGQGKLNAYRENEEDTNALWEKIVEMRKRDINVSVISVVSKANTRNGNLEKIKDWLLLLKDMRISGRINPCTNSPECELPMEELIEVYLNLAPFVMEHHLRWSPFIDIVHGLQNKSRVCVFAGCDPFHTLSATVLLGDGTITNCMRTNKTGILLQHPVYCSTRDEILQETSQENGGCKDCEYFLACHGGCPSVADDWRDRTYLCPLWKALFRYYKNVLGFCDGLPKVTNNTVSGSDSGRERVPIPGRPGWYHGDSDMPRGSHGDKSHGDSGHGDAPHGDAPHGDSN